MEMVLALLDVYRLPAVFIGAFFFGDSVILTAAYMAGQLGWEPLAIFAAAFLGTAAADSLWFVGGLVLARRVAGSAFLRREREKASLLLERLTGENPLYALILVKFFYGTRIAMILYTAARRIPFRLFALYNSIGILVWLTIFFPIGYLVGRGVAANFPLLNAVQAAVIVFVASFIVLRLLTLWLTKQAAA